MVKCEDKENKIVIEDRDNLFVPVLFLNPIYDCFVRSYTRYCIICIVTY